MRKTVLCVITSVFWLSVMQSVLMAADWPCFRGPTQNGISSESFVWPKDGPKQVWKTNVGVGHSAVSAVGKRVFTMGNTDDTDVVYCLAANTGKEIWHYAYACKARYFAPKPYDGPGATPTVSRGVVYTLSRMGHAFALDEKTGAVVWQRELAQEEGVKRPRWGFSGSPLVLKDRVILNVIPGGLCLDRKTGKTLWKNGAGEGGYATPVSMERMGTEQVVLFGTQTLTLLDPKTGHILWDAQRKQPIGLNAADPVVQGTRVFVSAGRKCGGAMYDVNSDKRPVWDNKNMNNHWPTCVLWQDYLYGCEGNNAAGAGRSPNALRCLNWNTGNIVWEEASIGFFSLIIVDAKLLMLTDHGVLIAAATSPAGYQELGRAQVIDEKCFTAPSFANNYVYLRNTEGDVVCVDMLLARR
jgi:outer membrane protein assembly factor BamB